MQSLKSATVFKRHAIAPMYNVHNLIDMTKIMTVNHFVHIYDSYVYKVVHKVTGHWYIGRQKNPKEIIGVNYFTGSKANTSLWFRDSFSRKSETKSDWIIHILYQGVDYKEVEDCEIIKHGLHHPIDNPLSLNFHNCGKNFATSSSNSLGYLMIIKHDTIKYIEKENLQYYLDNGWGRQSVRVHKNNITKIISIDALEEYVSLGWSRGIANEPHLKGKIVVHNNQIDCKFIYEDELDEYLSNGWERGNNTNDMKDRVAIHKDNVIKRVYQSDVESYLSSGWILGTGNSVVKSSVWMSKDDKTKMIKPNQVEEYVQNGWHLGRDIGNKSGNIVIHNNDGKILYVSEEELDYYLLNNWYLGRKDYKDGDLEVSTICRNGLTQYVNTSSIRFYVARGWTVVKSKRGRGLAKRLSIVNYEGVTKYVFDEWLDEHLMNGWQLGTKYKNVYPKDYIEVQRNGIVQYVFKYRLQVYTDLGWLPTNK